MRSYNQIWALWMLPVIVLTAAAAPSLHASAANDETGIWYGELDAGPRLFRFIIETHSPSESEGTITATLTSLDEGNAKFTLDDCLVDNTSMMFKLKATRAIYEGTLDASLQSVKGKWKQQGAVLDLEFRKVDTIPVDKPKETWVGTLKAGVQNLDLQLRGYETNAAGMSFYLDSLNQKAGGFKAKVAIEKDEFRIDVPALQATFSGLIDETGKEIVGKWKQGVSFDLVFKRMEQVAPPGSGNRKRPQHPVAPFPYDSRDVVFRNETEGIELAGTLTIPREARPHPLAILISGSGPQDRDETILEHKPFWVIADHLTRQGIAVLRYDDRGVGKSKGVFDKATTADFANDAKSAVEFAKTLTEIDSQRIGLIGHSEGGLIAPMVAATDPGVAWIILMAGPGVNGEEILYSQGQLMIAAEGGSLEAQKNQLSLQKATFRALNDRGRSETKTDDIVKSIVDELLKEQIEVPEQVKAGLEQSVRANWIEMNKPWFKYFALHEPGPLLKKVRCSVLAINGALDMQVDPKLNLTKIAEHLKTGGNTRFVTRELAGLNHMFQTCKSGGISEYEAIEESIAPLALTEMSDWIQSLRGK